MKKSVTALIMLVLIGLDQLFKYLSLIYLKPVSSVMLINNFLRLNYVQNTGAAFGLFKNNTVVLTVFTAFVIAFCLYFVNNHTSIVPRFYSVEKALRKQNGKKSVQSNNNMVK